MDPSGRTYWLDPEEKTDTSYGYITNEDWLRFEAERINITAKKKLVCVWQKREWQSIGSTKSHDYRKDSECRRAR